MEGGMTGPMVPAEMIRAVDSSFSYPSASIMGSRIEPTAEVSAMADPEIPANSMEARTVV